MEAEDAFEELREATHIEEAGEIAAIIASVSAEGAASASAAYPRLRQILEKYQECPQLLDPHLGQIITPLASQLRCIALPLGPPGNNLPGNVEAQLHYLKDICTVGQLLWAVVSVRGHKVAVKFFPQAAEDFELMVGVLQGLNIEALACQAGWWEAQCVVLLWLSQMVLLPFNLALLDSSLTAHSKALTPPLVQQLVTLCTVFLSSPASSSIMAGQLLARLLTRPDTMPALQSFLSWCVPALEPQGAQDVFRIPGVTQALANICKCGQRAVLLQFLPRIWPSAVKLVDGESAISSVLSRKMAMKLIQRLGLILLPPRNASWRYVASQTSLHASLADDAATNGVSGALVEENQMEMEYMAEEVEEALGLLLQGLQDTDTVVRWSASKGLGRICARLPKGFADEVVGQILELFQEAASDTAWHGACLALADLAHRGLLLPERLAVIAPRIADALHFEVRRGTHSVGAHVRDAAAYACWAFARAYPAQALAPIAPTLATSLVTVACYDREVNCRRAASAAFQEHVGRQGIFPHGIDVVTAADYFALSSRARAYEIVAPYIATFPEYNSCLREHLLHVKLRHWDRGLRELAASAVAKLVPTAPEYFSSTALDEMLAWCLSSNLQIAHGALLGVAENVLACWHAQQPITLDRQAAIADLVQTVADARHVRGKEGELLRSALCRLIECIALAQLPLTLAQQTRIRVILDDNLMHASAAVQSQAAQAFNAFCHAYLHPGCQAGSPGNADSDQELGTVATAYAARMSDVSSTVRQGCALALGALPPWLLLPAAPTVILSLAHAIQDVGQAEMGEAECRVAAVHALAAVTATLLSTLDLKEPSLAPAGGIAPSAMPAALVQDVFAALLEAMEDYSIDNRGDVGSWVREAAMAALAKLLPLLHQQNNIASEASGSSWSLAAVQAMVKQAVERIGRIREAAVKYLGLLLQSQPPLPGIASRGLLAALLADLDMHPSSHKGVSQMSALLAVAEYRRSILEGLIFSIGGMDGALSKAASAALAVHAEGCRGEEVAGTFLEIWKSRPPRLVVPLLRTADVLSLESFVKGNCPLAEKHAGDLLELVESEVQRSRHVRCLSAATTVLCRLVDCAEPVHSGALNAISKLMISKYPKVRKAAAEQLYLQLLSPNDEDEMPEAKERVCEILLTASWEGSLEAAKAANIQIRPLLGL